MSRTSPDLALTGALVDLASQLAARALFSTFPDPRDTIALALEGGPTYVVTVDEDAYASVTVRVFVSASDFDAFDDACDARDVDGVEVESPSHLLLYLGERKNGPQGKMAPPPGPPEASRVTVGGEKVPPSPADHEVLELVARALLVVSDEESIQDPWDGDGPFFREMTLETPNGPRRATVTAPVNVPREGLLGALEAEFAAGGDAYAEAVCTLVAEAAASPEGTALGAPLMAVPYLLAMSRELLERPLSRLRPAHLREVVIGILPEHRGPASVAMRAHPENTRAFVDELRAFYIFLERAHGYERARAMIRVLDDRTVEDTEKALRESAAARSTVRLEAKAKVATATAAHRAKKAKRKAESKAKRKNR